MFMTQLVIGALMIGLTVVIHAVALDRLMRVIEYMAPAVYMRFRHGWKIPLLIIAVLGCFLALTVEIWIWAQFYLQVGALGSLEEALYFSTSTFTTVGYGDIVLSPDWRLISSFQSANGFILFGWSTAFIFEVTSKLYKQEHIEKIKN